MCSTRSARSAESRAPRADRARRAATPALAAPHRRPPSPGARRAPAPAGARAARAAPGAPRGGAGSGTAHRAAAREARSSCRCRAARRGRSCRLAGLIFEAKCHIECPNGIIASKLQPRSTVRGRNRRAGRRCHHHGLTPISSAQRGPHRRHGGSSARREREGWACVGGGSVQESTSRAPALCRPSSFGSYWAFSLQVDPGGAGRL